MTKREAAAILRCIDLIKSGDAMRAAGYLLLLTKIVREPRKPIPKVRKGTARRGPMRSLAYRQWCALAPCAMVAAMEGELELSDDADCSVNRFRDPAHTENNGMRSKGPDSSCVPLCRAHHTEYDAGRAAFEAKYGVNMKALAAEHYRRFCVEKGVEADFDPRDDYRK